MDNASYIVLSRQKSLFTAMDNIASNVANANTSGFKSESLIFQDYVVQNLDSQEELAFSHDVATHTNYEQGALISTQRTFDVGISGSGFFQLETPLGVRYTRSGNFSLDLQGFLVSKEGYYVLGTTGERISLNLDDTNIQISSDGIIEANEEQRGRIGIMDIANPQLMNKLGTGMYEYNDENTPPYPGENYTLVQGMLEQSNVNSIKEITRMIEVSRAVGTTSGFLSDINELQKKAVDTIASTQ